MTTLTYLGHASFLFETDKAACLVDPWFTPKGAFLGTWRQLPPNDHALAWVLEKMKQKPVMVYVTHEHEDHYDQDTLKALLPKAAGLYIPRYENTFLRDLIVKNLGVAPELLSEDEPRRFHDIDFRIFIDESGINRDSAIFLKSVDMSFLDVNDCKIYDRAVWLRERCGEVDVLSCQFSGANMHPICYDMPEDKLRDVSRQKKLRKFVAVRQFLKDMNPRHYLPSAGPALFSLPRHEALNFQAETIFPKWWEFRAWLENKGQATPFVALDVLGAMTTQAGGDFRVEGRAEPIPDAALKDMIAQYRRRDAAEAPAAPVSRAEALAFFEREINEKLAVLKGHPETRLGGTLYIEIADAGGDSFYCIDPDRRTLETCTKDALVPPYYLHQTDTAALGRLLRSGKGWGTYFLSFTFRNRRVPDVFDSVLATFFVANDRHDLDFGLRKLAEFRDSAETITLVSPDRKTSVTCKRFCPHQGADLTYAKFDGRYVVCPRHQWRFDCEKGGKADHSGDTIEATVTKTGAASDSKTGT